MLDTDHCEEEGATKEEQPGHVKAVFRKGIAFGWGVKGMSKPHHSVLIGYFAKDGVHKLLSSVNIHNEYYMECYSNGNEYRATIYSKLLVIVEGIITVEVTSCELDILNSITVMPRQGMKHTFLTIDQQSCCTKHTFNHVKREPGTGECPDVSERGLNDRNIDGYLHGWSLP